MCQTHYAGPISCWCMPRQQTLANLNRFGNERNTHITALWRVFIDDSFIKMITSQTFLTNTRLEVQVSVATSPSKAHCGSSKLCTKTGHTVLTCLRRWTTCQNSASMKSPDASQTNATDIGCTATQPTGNCKSQQQHNRNRINWTCAPQHKRMPRYNTPMKTTSTNGHITKSTLTSCTDWNH